MASSAELALIMSLVDEVTGTAEKVKGSLKDVGEEARGLKGTLNEAFGGLAKIGGGMIIGGIGAAAAAVTGLGAAALAAGMDFDSAFDTLIQQTGASGEELEALKADVTTVFKSLPVDIGAAAEVIAQLNMGLDVTGATAQQLASQLLMIGTADAATTTALYTQTINSWGVANTDAAATLDQIYRASQLSGAGVDELLASVNQNGVALRAMGFDLTESVGLLASWEKAGISSGAMVSGMSRAMKEFADAGIPAREGLIDTIQAIDELGPGAEATAMAIEAFGSRAGPQLAQAIAEGRLSMHEFTEAMQDSEGAILNTAQATMDFPEKLQEMKNMAQTALAPIGLAIMDIVSKLLESLMPAFERLTGWLEGTLAPAVDAAMPHIEALITAFGALLSGDTEAFWSGITEGLPALEELQGVWDRVWGNIQTTFEILIGVVSGHIETFKLLFSGDLMGAWENLTATWAEAIGKIWPMLEETFGPIVTNITGWLQNEIPLAIEGAKAFVTEKLWPVLAEMIAKAVDWLQTEAPVLAADLGSKIGNAIQQGVTWIKDNIGPHAVALWNGIKEMLSSAWVNLQTEAPALAADLGSKIGNAIQQGVTWVQDNVGPYAAQVWTSLKTMLMNAWAYLTTEGPTIGADLGNNLGTAIRTGIQWIRDNVGPLAADLWAGIKEVFSKGVAEFSENHEALGANAGEVVGKIIRFAIGGLLLGAAELGKLLFQGMTAVFEFLTTTDWSAVMSQVAETIKRIFAGGTTESGKEGEMTGLLLSFFRSFLDGFMTGLTGDPQWANKLSDFFRGLIDSAKQAILDKIGEIEQAGKDLIAGFVEGIKGAPGVVADAAKGVASGVVNAVRGFLDAKSPSRVMIDIGKDTMTGLAMGIDQGQAKVLEKVGEFLLGLSAMFGVLTSQDMGGLDAGRLRARVDAIAEVLVYAINRFADIQRLYGYKEIKELDKTVTRFGRMLEVIAKDLSKIKGLEDPTAISRFFSELEQVIHHALALARRIGGEYGKALLEEMGKVSELILKVLSLTGFDPASLKLAEKGLPDLVKWGEQLYAIIVRATEVLADVRKAISDSLLAEYAGVTENIMKVLALTQGANIENMLAIAGEKFPDLELWGQRLYAMIVRGAEVLQAVRVYIADEALKEVVGISEYLSKVANLFQAGGVEQMRALTKEEFPDLTAWANRLYRMFATGIEVFKAVRAYIDDVALAAATGISESLGKVAQIFSVGGLAAMRELAEAEMPDLFQWGQTLFNMIEWGIAVFRSVRQQIEDKALAEVTGISESLGKVTQLFSVGGLAAMRELVTLEFPSLDAWAGRLFHMIVAGINVLLAVRAQIDDKMLKIVVGVAEGIAVIAQLFEAGGIAAMEKLTTAKWPDLTLWGQRLYAMITSAIDVLKGVRNAVGAKLLDELAGIAEALGKAWAVVELRTDIGVTPAKFLERLVSHLDAIVDAVPLVRDALQRVRNAGTTLETLAAEAELSEKLKSFFSILDLNKVFQEVQVIKLLSAGERRTALSNVLTNLGIMLEAAAPILRAALEKFREQWGSLEALAEDVDLSETVKKLFSILDVSKVMEEMRIAKPLAKGEKRLPFVEVLTGFIEQMKEAAPLIRDGLQEISDIFAEQEQNMAAVADRVRDVFASLASAVQAASEMTVSRWNLGNVLRMIGEIATASRAVSQIPVPEFGAPVTPGGDGASTAGDRGGLDPAAIKAAIIEGIQGSAIVFDLSLVQDPSQRAEFSFRLGRLERMFAEFVTRWEAAGA